MVIKLKLTKFMALFLIILLTHCNSPPVFSPDTPTATNTLTPTASPTLTPLPTTPPSATISVLSNAPTMTITPRSQQNDILSTLTPTPRRYQNDTLPTSTPPPGIACSITSAKLDLCEGPGHNYRIISTLPVQTTLWATKRTEGDRWLLINTSSHETGWVKADYISCQDHITRLPVAQGVTVQPPPSATPRPSPTFTPSPIATSAPAIPVGQWQGDYYDNASLLGEPVFSRVDENLEFNWILDSPDPRIPNDNFSVRWTGVMDFFEGGDYRFFATVDDGIKIYVDGWQVMDAWHTALPVDYEGGFADLQAGLHTVVVEYFESGGHAHIKVWAKRDTFVDTRWQGDYYNNLDWQEPATFSQSSKNIDFDWGGSAPDHRLSNNNFSVRWQRTFFFDADDYKFLAEVEDQDKITVYLDGWTIIDTYSEHENRIIGGFDDLGAGYHTITVEYQDHGDKAKVKVWWERD